MNCPFCRNRLRVAGIICPDCRMELPAEHLIPIYSKLLAERRDLANIQNRTKLDELALKEYSLRVELINQARETQSEKIRKDLIEARRYEEVRTAESLAAASAAKAKKKKTVRRVATFLAPILLLTGIAIGVNTVISNKATQKLHKDCGVLVKLNQDISIQQDPLFAIENLASGIILNPATDTYDFAKAKLEVDKNIAKIRNTNISHVGNNLKNFWADLLKKSSRLSQLLGIGKPNQKVSDVRFQNQFLTDGAMEYKSALSSSPCSEISKVLLRQKNDSKYISFVSGIFLLKSSTTRSTPSNVSGLNQANQSPSKVKNVATSKDALAAVMIKKLQQSGINCSMEPGNQCNFRFDQGEVFDSAGKSFGRGGEVRFVIGVNNAENWLNASLQAPDKVVRNYCRYYDGKDYLGVYGFYKLGTAVVTKSAIFVVGMTGGIQGFSLFETFQKWEASVVAKIINEFGGVEACQRTGTHTP